MARTIAQIYDSMIAYKDAQSTLSDLAPAADTLDNLMTDLNSRSKVSVWRLMVYVFAVAAFVLETLFDTFIATITNLLATQKVGTTGWYAKRAKEFQLGYTVIVVNEVPTYSTIDTTAQIVKRSAATENPSTGRVTIKVAKELSGSPVPLSATEKAQFEAYINAIKVAGTGTDVISLSPDKVRVNAIVFYDPLLVDTDVQASVNAALVAYMADLPFNGRVVRNSIIDAIQATAGVIDVAIGSLDYQSGVLPYANIGTEYQTLAGYAILDPASTITMQPYV